MISPGLITVFYDAASMQRWNDYPRLVELNELDKQSHKFTIAFLLAAYENDINYHNLIEAGIFEFLRRVIVTDIRPDVFREVMQEKQTQINAWVLEKIKAPLETLENGQFLARMSRYISDPAFYQKERNLLAAAHYLATRWEFGIVYQSGRFLSDMEDLKKAVEADIEKFMHYRGVVEIGLGTKLSQIVDLCGRLRFQIRWAQTPRLPKTSVLGHELIVALFAYFYSRKVGACQARTVNNFFCALFHDLPEALTRDIISPVKRSVEGLESLIVGYEVKLINQKILPLIPDNIKDHFSYLLGLYEEGGYYNKDEFKNRIRDQHFIRTVSDVSAYNEDHYGAIDGRALKACDHLAAFTEAVLSISYGIKSRELENGVKLKEYYREKGPIGGVDFADLMQKIEEYLET